MIKLLDLSNDILDSILQLTLDITENNEARNVQIHNIKGVCKRFASMVHFKDVHTAKLRGHISKNWGILPDDVWLAFVGWLSRHGHTLESLNVYGASNPNDILRIMQSHRSISSLVVHDSLDMNTHRSLSNARITHSIGPNLKYLELNGYCILNTPLFDGLQTLKLGEHVTVRPSFKFPASLKELDVYNAMDWEPIHTYGAFESLTHLRLECVPPVFSTPFPSTLKSLRLGCVGACDSAKLEGNVFPLPPHLTTLELALSDENDFSTFNLPQSLVRVQVFAEEGTLDNLSKIPSSIRDLALMAGYLVSEDEDGLYIFSLGTQLQRFTHLENLAVGEMCILDDDFYDSLVSSHTLSSLWVWFPNAKIPIPSSLKNLALWSDGPQDGAQGAQTPRLVDTEVLLRTHLNLLVLHVDIGPIWLPHVCDMWQSLNTLVICGVRLLETLFPPESRDVVPLAFAGQEPHLTIVFDLTDLSMEKLYLDDCGKYFEYLRCIAPLVERVILITWNGRYPDVYVPLRLREMNAKDMSAVNSIQLIIPHAHVDVIFDNDLHQHFCISRGFNWMHDIQNLKECPRHTFSPLRPLIR